MLKSVHRAPPAVTALTALTLLTGAGTAAAQASQDVSPPSPAQSLSCLTRPEAPPEFPKRSKYDRTGAFARVQLRFTAPDQGPEMALLSNTMRDDQLDAVRRHVAQYRLPCLQASDGAVQAVQEFKWNNSELDPLPLPPARPGDQPLCVVQPAEAMSIRQIMPTRAIEHVVLTMVFTPGGPPQPEIHVLYTDASEQVLEAVREWVGQTRMPCLTGVTPASARKEPVVLRQTFHFRPYGHRAFTFTDARLSLTRFLGMTQDVERLKADFDFNSMHCPFKVNYTIYGPRLPNEVTAGRPVDPNRVAFLRWLSERNFDFKTEKMANDLFGQTVQIDIPCGQLALDPDAPAAK